MGLRRLIDLGVRLPKGFRHLDATLGAYIHHSSITEIHKSPILRYLSCPKFPSRLIFCAKGRICGKPHRTWTPIGVQSPVSAGFSNLPFPWWGPLYKALLKTLLNLQVTDEKTGWLCESPTINQGPGYSLGISAFRSPFYLLCNKNLALTLPSPSWTL